MLRPLTTEERDAFLAKPVTGVLLLRRNDGSPLLAPVWHEWVDGHFYFVIGVGDVKWRCIERDPTVAYAVFGQEPPFHGVEAHGRAVVVETGRAAWDRLMRIAIRYVGPQRAARFMHPIEMGALATIDLQVERIRTFDQGEVDGLGLS